MSSPEALTPSVEATLELPGGGRALFTDQTAGNLSTGAGEHHEQGFARREQLCERLGLRWLCSSRQTHGTSVNTVTHVTGRAGEALAIDADAHATALRGVGMMVMAADCLPVALGCTGAVAIVHAGWRGLAAGVLEAGVTALRELPLRGRCGDEEPIEAIVGPCAGVCCYEVGAEVHAAFGGAHSVGRHIDLRAIAHERLAGAGVGRVRDVQACTICDERFFSYRREGERAGRQAGVAWLS
jgi:YfiH family protein